VMKRSVITWVITSPPEASGEVSMSELEHFFFLLNHHGMVFSFSVLRRNKLLCHVCLSIHTVQLQNEKDYKIMNVFPLYWIKIIIYIIILF
jgi:hypothetical protein